MMSRVYRYLVCMVTCSLCYGGGSSPLWGDDNLFKAQVAPILEKHCLACHGQNLSQGGLAFHTFERALAGGESGKAIVAGDPAASLIIDYVSGDDPTMPKGKPPLAAAEVEALRTWIEGGAPWPAGMVLHDRALADTDWWSLRPLTRPAIPQLANDHWSRNPVDRFVLARLREHDLSPSEPADRRTLIRRLTFDLHGLPPTPEQVLAFVNDADPHAYENLVEGLLASPRYGERWARHWLDVVHYADTHGYDKDKLRLNAWPYRDYVVRSLNSDKPYSQFVQEQMAGDALYPHTADGIVGLGFLAAGPWDYVGHAEVPETKIDGKIARHLDRDDMVRTVMETFTSTTVGCARCHNHKFDPVSQEDYYSLQAVFAAIDRADRPYESNPQVARQRLQLAGRLQQLQQQHADLHAQVLKEAGPQLAQIDKELAQLSSAQSQAARPEFGYHSRIEKRANVEKWVQVDLGESQSIAAVVVVGCHDNFNNIGAGFGFPVRFKIEAANEPEFKSGVVLVADHTTADFTNPGVTPQSFVLQPPPLARYVRVTATRLAPRSNDYIFALAELQTLSPSGVNLSAGKPVVALDSIEAPPRWQRPNLVDGYYHGASSEDLQKQQTQLAARRAQLLADQVSAPTRQQFDRLQKEIEQTKSAIEQLPKPELVYAGAIHDGSGSFRGTAHNGGRPREIRVLSRGEITQPGPLVGPGTLAIIPGEPSRWDLSPDVPEQQRRAALARWIVHRDNPLTWRSIVNRVWLYHFGRGIVDSPGDLGRMGQLPTHPELLDWLAVEFRDGEQSFKQLHRLICNSATYRQAVVHDERSEQIDGSNQYYWRGNRRRLEAEAIRDAALAISGRLDARMYGPGFWCFLLEKPQHSPHYEYQQFDPEDPKAQRRSIYRFVVRSAPDPFLEVLDCADPSQLVDKRNETITPLSALGLLNNRMMTSLAEHFAGRLTRDSADPAEQIGLAFALAFARPPTEQERQLLTNYAEEHGLANACRLLLNMNEFVFVD